MPTPLEAYYSLRRKYPKAAVLKEVTVPDEEAALIYRSALAARSPYYRRKFRKSGEACDAPVPADYDLTNVRTSRRIDYLIFDGQMITAVELKVTKADFRRDTEEKRRPWKQVTNRFVYLTPEGLLTPEEVPAGCGLWEITPSGHINVVKKAVKNPTPDPFPPSMIKYFAWRVFNAETKANKPQSIASLPTRTRGRKTRKYRR